ncbi:hypothetical protein AX16_006787 [Volvariella volvacea WC 439]|nr:hypothetical protein AX16_006787 [Volvariella volvacea WC 439]
MPNPLKRLSVALKFTKPVASSLSAATSPRATEPASLAQFLVSTKERYLKDVNATPSRAGDWTVVMGNEAGDLDSLASSIAFAYLYNKQHSTPTVPLIQTKRSDLALRAENLYAFSLAGLTDLSSQLLTVDDLPSHIGPFPSHKFALVDHNRLDSQFSDGQPNATVMAVVDHHADEGLYTNTAHPRLIVQAGSCASHIGELFSAAATEANEAQEEAAVSPANDNEASSPEGASTSVRDTFIPPQLATLLISAILIDTNNLKPGGKALQPDISAMRYLLPNSTLSPSISSILLTSLEPGAQDDDTALQLQLHTAPALKELSDTLSAKKADVSHLSGRDLLRRDYKEYTHPLNWLSGTPHIKVGLATVPVPLTTSCWSPTPQTSLVNDANVWMEERELTVLGVLTSFRAPKKKGITFSLGGGKKGKHKREMAWFIQGGIEGVDVDQLAERLFKGLEASKELKLKKHSDKKLGALKNVKTATNIEGGEVQLRAKVYKQGNADATRKTTAPLVKEILEGGSGESSEPEEDAAVVVQAAEATPEVAGDAIPVPEVITTDADVDAQRNGDAHGPSMDSGNGHIGNGNGNGHVDESAAPAPVLDTQLKVDIPTGESFSLDAPEQANGKEPTAA